MREITPRPETWLLWLLFATALWCASGFAQAAHGQDCYYDPISGQTICSHQPSGWQSASYASQQYTQQPTPHPSRCRLTNNMGFTGTGTLVDNRTGLIITCAHIFRESQQGIIATFPNGRRFEARWVGRDPNPNVDLAAVRIRPTDIETLPVDTSEQTGALTVGGFGPDGTFQAVTGQIVGRTACGSTIMQGTDREGDSGGGVFNTRRQLVGVAWGCDGQGVYVTSGLQFGNFLGRVLDKVLPNRSGALIARTTPRRGNGSPGGAYNGQQPGYYGEPPYEQPPPPYVGSPPLTPPVADIDPTPDAPEPDIDYEAWEEQQEENEKRHAQTQEQLQSLVVKVDNIDTGQWVEPLLAVQDRLTAVENSLVKLTENDNRIINIITKLESQPATGTTAPAGPQISYYDIVPRKK